MMMMSNRLRLINNTSSDHCSRTPRGSEESKGLHDAVQSFQSAHFTHHSVDLWLFTESKGGGRADSPVNHKHHPTQPALWIRLCCNNSRQSFLTAGSAASFNLSAAFIGFLLHPVSLPPQRPAARPLSG